MATEREWGSETSCAVSREGSLGTSIISPHPADPCPRPMGVEVSLARMPFCNPRSNHELGPSLPRCTRTIAGLANLEPPRKQPCRKSRGSRKNASFAAQARCGLVGGAATNLRTTCSRCHFAAPGPSAPPLVCPASPLRLGRLRLGHPREDIANAKVAFVSWVQGSNNR